MLSLLFDVYLWVLLGVENGAFGVHDAIALDSGRVFRVVEVKTGGEGAFVARKGRLVADAVRIRQTAYRL